MIHVCKTLLLNSTDDFSRWKNRDLDGRGFGSVLLRVSLCRSTVADLPNRWQSWIVLQCNFGCEFCWRKRNDLCLFLPFDRYLGRNRGRRCWKCKCLLAGRHEKLRFENDEEMRNHRNDSDVFRSISFVAIAFSKYELSLVRAASDVRFLQSADAVFRLVAFCTAPKTAIVFAPFVTRVTSSTRCLQPCHA